MSRPRLLLTRPEPQSRVFAEMAQERFGADLEAVISPLLRIEHLPLTRDPAGFDGLVFTSRNGVAAFAAASDLRDVTAWCVGDATARAAAAAGLSARSAAGALADLAWTLRRDAAGLTMLQVRGRHVAGDLAALVGPAGPRITEAILYEQHPQPLTSAARAALSGTTPLLLPLFSPRSAGLIAPEIANANAPLHIAAMSPAVAEALPLQARGGAVTAPTPDAEGMLRALAELLQRVKSA